ncbi:hypothetical protein U3516DRAFT_738282 [Neocallimastix sp. 'constans']
MKIAEEATFDIALLTQFFWFDPDDVRISIGILLPLMGSRGFVSVGFSLPSGFQSLYKERACFLVSSWRIVSVVQETKKTCYMNDEYYLKNGYLLFSRLLFKDLLQLVVPNIRYSKMWLRRVQCFQVINIKNVPVH